MQPKSPWARRRIPFAEILHPATDFTEVHRDRLAPLVDPAYRGTRASLPPYGKDATIATGAVFGLATARDDESEAENLPRGLYCGLVGTVPRASAWTDAQKEAWKRHGLCIVRFNGRGDMQLAKKLLRFSAFTENRFGLIPKH